MKHCMVDIETFGKSNKAVIASIGAVKFNPYTGLISNEYFDCNIDASSCEKVGLEMDSSTIYWWLSQPKEIQESLLKDQVDLKKGLQKFTKYISGCDYIWSHSTFDAIILSNAYRLSKLRIPWRYTNLRDIRTITSLISSDEFKALYRKTQEDVGHAHEAVYDALRQAVYVSEIYKRIGLREY